MKRASALAALVFFLSPPPSFAGVAPSYLELQDAPTIIVDWSKGDTQAVTLHGNRTLVFANSQKGGKYMLIVTQDGTGSRTLTFPSSVRWPGNTPPINPPLLTTTANKTDYITFFYNGVNYDALGIAQNY